MTARPGLILAAIFLCIYGTLAVVVNLPKATYGFKSDEATYYMIGLSLAYDGDLAYRKEDLVRVWREFPSGPTGVFLKRGQTVTGAPDPDQERYFYGKSFIYPLFAAPFILLFGSNGFLVLNALSLALVLLCGYLFLHARSGAWPSALLAAGFVMASVVPVYFVQMMPETFNFSLAALGYFCWLYKEVASPERSPRRTAWLFTGKSDIACAVLLGLVTFSKPTNVTLIAAPLLWWLFRRSEGSVLSAFTRRIIPVSLAFAIVAGGLFGINTAISGSWNYQGGDRTSYYDQYPFQQDVMPPKAGEEKSRDGWLLDIIFNPRTFTTYLTHNLQYFFFGRHAGLLAYFFPGMFALVALLAAPRSRPGWQWLVLGSAVVQGLIFVIGTPYTWSGGGVGNRYFFTGYAVMLFLLPPIESIAVALAPWAIGGLFVAPMVVSPFSAAFRPAEIAKAGPLRLLPVELTLLNDLPIVTEGERSRMWFGDLGQGDAGFLVTFLDDNAYNKEDDKSFWTRGDSRADLVLKTDRPIRKAAFMLAAGPVPVEVKITIAGRSQSIHLDSGQTAQMSMAMPPGLRYEKEHPNGLLWNASVTTSGGFTPIFYDAATNDARYLGVRMKPMLEPRP